MSDETKPIPAIRATCQVSVVALIHAAALFFFSISQTTPVGRCEFLSDSDGDKRSELVMTMPWVGVCLL